MKTCTKCAKRKKEDQFHRYFRKTWKLRALCKQCHNKQCRAWQRKNPEKGRAAEKRWSATHPGARSKVNRNNRKALRLLVYSHYCKGKPKCACCGEDHYEFLSIDHTDGGGRRHREELKSSHPRTLIAWLRKNNFPPGFRVLCMNCNTSYGFHGYCPHQKGKKS